MAELNDGPDCRRIVADFSIAADVDVDGDAIPKPYGDSPEGVFVPPGSWGEPYHLPIVVTMGLDLGGGAIGESQDDAFAASRQYGAIAATPYAQWRNLYVFGTGRGWGRWWPRIP